MSERLLSASICLLLLTSMAPTVTAVGPSDSVIWGISYDWANYENDIEEITGIDTNAANEDLEAAADYAGFLLESDQVISGMTQFFIESWDDDETVEITDANGDTHEVTKRVTEQTIRHGNLGDMGFTAAWTDENESIDIWMSASTEQLFVIDAAYTEYVDDELMVYGGDLDMSGEFALESNMEFNLQVIAANEVLAPELGMGFSVSFEIPSINSQWRTDEPLDYLHHLSEEPTGNSNDSTDNGSIGDEYQSGLVEGDFSTITGYSMMLSIEGIPAEDFDINLDAFNVQLSDSIPGQGIFSEEMNVLS